MRLSGIDRGPRAEMAALACCVLLAALALWLLVRLVWLLLPHGDAALDAAPARVAAGATATETARSIASWHLFGDTPRRPGSGPGGSASTLALILRGTVAQNDPKAGFAVIADGANGERTFRVGEEVVSGVQLGAVYADRIILLRGAAEETLKLPRDSNLAPADVVRATPATAGSRAAGTRADASPKGASAAAAPAAQTVKAPTDWQQTVDRLRQNPDELMKRVQIVPVLDGGKLTGVRVSAGADAALINQIGLRPGDIVTSVNGMPVDSLSRGQDIMSSLKNSSSVRVTVLRDGKPADVTVGLQ
ncbi:MAG TPA: type II secretion system protein N [Dokdonella sp.]